LVEAEFVAVGHPDRGDPSPLFLADRSAELDPLAFEFPDGRLDVIAHEVELVMTGIVSRVGGQLCGREGEDGPPVARIHRRKLEHVPKERANGVLRPW
jgi:hypothetical protein